jgi:hypothetical protein
MQCRDCEFKGDQVIHLPQDPVIVQSIGPPPPKAELRKVESQLYLYQSELYMCSNCKNYFMLATHIAPILKPGKQTVKQREAAFDETTVTPTS